MSDDSSHAPNLRLVTEEEARAAIEQERTERIWPQGSIRHVSAHCFKNEDSQGKSLYTEFSRRLLLRKIAKNKLPKNSENECGGYPIMCRVFALTEGMLGGEVLAKIDTDAAKEGKDRVALVRDRAPYYFKNTIIRDLQNLGVMARLVERKEQFIMVLPFRVTVAGERHPESLNRDVEGEVMTVAYMLRRGLVSQEQVERTIGASTVVAALSGKIQGKLDAAGIKGLEKSVERVL